MWVRRKEFDALRIRLDRMEQRDQELRDRIHRLERGMYVYSDSPAFHCWQLDDHFEKYETVINMILAHLGLRLRPVGAKPATTQLVAKEKKK